MVDAGDLGRMFKQGATKGRTNNIKIINGKNKTYVVDYDWAILGSRDKKTGKITYYSGWDGYSPTTSKHISQLGLRYSADRIMKAKKHLDDVM